MKVCIICHEVKEDFDIEHVIPDSLAGYFTIDTVCKSCNNRFGTQLDHYLTNCFFIEMKRNELGLSGRKGKVPDPLVGDVTLDSNPEEIRSVKRNRDGQLVVQLKTTTNIEKDEMGNPVRISIRGARSNEKHFPGILEKITIRNKIPKEAIVTKVVEVQKMEHEPVSRRFIIDYSKLMLAVIKIAYEFAATILPKYLEDEKAARISRMLQNVDKFTVDVDFLNRRGYLLPEDLVKSYVDECSKIIDLYGNNHYLILLQSPWGLACHVNIFNMVNQTVLLTDNSKFLDEERFFVLKNDIENKTYQILDWDALNAFYLKNSML